MRNGEYNLAIAPEEYPGKVYRGRYIPEHHLVWWENTGEVVGEDEVIHHKNGCKTDNSFENLEKVSRSEHGRMHADGRQMVVLECPNCGEVFEKRIGHTFISDPHKDPPTSCSRSCAMKFYHSDKDRYDNTVSMYTE